MIKIKKFERWNSEKMKIRNLDHLKYFLDAMDAGGIIASAARNRVAASTVSQAIRQLEAQLDVSLLEHSRNAFRPTEAALILREEGARLLARVAEVEGRVRETAH